MMPRYAILTIDTLDIAIPQSELRALEPIVDVEAAGEEAHCDGWISLAEGRFPVYFMSREFSRAAQPLKDHRILAMLGAESAEFGLACTSVASIEEAQLRRFPVPPCSARLRLPIRGMALKGGRLMYLSGIEELQGAVSP